jgi:ATP-dependent DNA helicase RecQ
MFVRTKVEKRSVTSSDTPAVRDALRRVFGFEALHPGQSEALDSVLAGRDTLLVQPTGSGTSLVYQVAALALDATVIVVSPLIALMQDQVQGLRERSYPGAAALHSHLPEAEEQSTIERLRAGKLRLLYVNVTPERCASDAFLQVAARAGVGLFAIDEAHYISEWGHDFRPSYLLLAEAARALGGQPIRALTATATPWVRESIVSGLGMRDPRVVVRGAEDLTADSSGSGIVYTQRTASARQLAQTLNRSGVHAAYYHGRLKPSQRTAVQQHFHEGRVRAIAATNAFGLGIDRGDLRFVVHYDAPPSLEAYYQEAGRAGRDGGPGRHARGT